MDNEQAQKWIFPLNVDPYWKRVLFYLRESWTPREDDPLHDYLKREGFDPKYFPQSNPRIYDRTFEQYFGGGQRVISPHTFRALSRQSPEWAKKLQQLEEWSTQPWTHDNDFDTYYRSFFEVGEKENIQGLWNNAMLNSIGQPITPMNEVFLEILRRSPEKMVKDRWWDPVWALEVHLWWDALVVDNAKAFYEWWRELLHPFCVTVWEYVGIYNYEYM